VAWAPVIDEDVAGYHVYGRSATMEEPQRLDTELIGGTEWAFERPPGVESFYISVTAVDMAGNESLPSPEVSLFDSGIELAGPFPHPVEEVARFELTLPLDPEGELPVEAEFFAVSGLRVRRWLDEPMPAGATLTLWWDGRSDGGEPVAPGLYFLKLTAGGHELTRRLYVSR
jgi:hypothetical protein